MSVIQPSPALPLWRRQYAEAINSLPQLLQELGLEACTAADFASDFPLRVPRPYLSRMRYGDSSDPLLRQVLPVSDERAPDPLGLLDPVGDGAALKAPGVLHKYQGRVLLILTGACAVHCRYCFRRDFPYAEQGLNNSAVDEALAYITQDPSIREVILSGGDPLSWSDQRLAGLVAELERIPHLQRLRIHTRLPVVIPSRVDAELLRWLAGSRLQRVVVLHVNHAQELDAELILAIAALKAQGVTLLNQSVLLAGVNDEVDALCNLSERLFEVGVLPYYLHKLDRARGVAHFAVLDSKAKALMRGVRARLPGYLVPRYVVEVAGAEAKLPA